MTTSLVHTPKLMIIDACVLIDYMRSEPALIQMISRYVGPVHVVSVVFEEVSQIKSQDELEALGLVLVEPELEDLFTAASVTCPTSFQDNLCLLTAKRNNFTCITNDKNLRKRCNEMAVPLLWGLQLIAELHNNGGIPTEDAVDIAKTIQANNPKHITPAILERFQGMLTR